MKNFNISLKLLTPVHIGGGNSLTKKDFEIKGNMVHIYNPPKLHSLLGHKYEDFLLSHQTLTDFLYSGRFDVGSALDYSLPSPGGSIRKSDNLVAFIKDPYGLPYIPGSSLKGALRTVLLAQHVREKRSSAYSRYANQPIAKHNARSLEEQSFGKFNQSIFKLIKISDSQPLAKEDLILCKKVDVFRDGNTNNKLNLCRESIKPGTQVNFTLTLDGKLLQRGDSMIIKWIMDAVKNFNKEYEQAYLMKFRGFEKAHDYEHVLRLGGGTGFLTKTINQALYGERTVKQTAHFLQSKFRQHNHNKDVGLGVSPRALKCTMIGNKVLEMGLCQIRID